jgi:acyl-CoA thioesterase-1
MTISRTKIVIIGDSNSMPRLEVEYDDTYISKLKQSFPAIDFIDKCKRGGTTNRFVQEGAGFKDTRRGADLLEYYKPSVVITQMGIVDCAPRLVRAKSFLAYSLMVSPSFIRNRAYVLLKKYKKRDIKNAEVSPERFRSNWENFLQRAALTNTKVIAIKITHPTERFKEKNPDIPAAIKMYNDLLDSFRNDYPNLITFDPFEPDEVDNFVLDDGYHYNTNAHKHIFSKLSKLIG